MYHVKHNRQHDSRKILYEIEMSLLSKKDSLKSV